MNWVNAITNCTDSNTAFVLVSILKVRGSAPRAVQSKMVVTASDQYDSIGGGNLEYAAINRGRELLAENVATLEQQQFTLGDDLTQCCGGEVTLLFECFPASNFNIVLCGAGHVGRALVDILRGLPCRVSWLDERKEMLEQALDNAGKPSNISIQVVSNPYHAIEQCPANSYFLVMTHSHDTDFAYCEAILGRQDIAFCGLIGSQSKAGSFRGRLKRKQYSEQEITRLTSPVGLELGAGKQPMEVAVSIAAQLLQLYSQAQACVGGVVPSPTEAVNAKL